MLIVQEEGDQIVCHREGDVGMYIEGRGSTVAEAVGMWCIYSTMVTIRCDPPELLDRFRAKKVKKFIPVDKRA